jgi:ABC-type nickel/cobalt efflux system permease component RcnA
MSATAWMKFAAIVLAVVAGVSCWVAWREVRRQRTQLQNELRAAQTQVTQAEARQQSRETELNALLDKMEKERVAVRTPAEVLKALPGVLPLPKPLSFEEFQGAQTAGTLGTASALPDGPTPKVLLPVEDLKPLYDFSVGCRECQARLATAASDLKDEQAKTQTLSRERDDALRVARGGSVLQRVARAAKWFVIGAAAGAIAAKIVH